MALTLTEARVGVFYDTPLAVLFNSAVSRCSDTGILYVEVSQTSTAVGHSLQTSVRHQLAPAETQLLQVGAAASQDLEILELTSILISSSHLSYKLEGKVTW